MACALLAQWATSQLLELKAHLEGLLEDRRTTLQAGIDGLNARLGRLEVQFAEDKAQTMRELEARNRELTEKLEDFQVTLSAGHCHAGRCPSLPSVLFSIISVVSYSSWFWSWSPSGVMFIVLVRYARRRSRQSAKIAWSVRAAFKATSLSTSTRRWSDLRQSGCVHRVFTSLLGRQP